MGLRRQTNRSPAVQSQTRGKENVRLPASDGLMKARLSREPGRKRSLGKKMGIRENGTVGAGVRR